MKRWLILILLCIAVPAGAFQKTDWKTRQQAFWQSRDSNYNVNIASISGYTGPGDVTGFTTNVLAWWGLRGYNSSTSGAIFRICDSATGLVCADATWSSAGGGTLTLPTVGGFICDNTVHKCEISKLYDQSGASSCSGPCDVSNGIGVRPTLLINCLGSKPCMVSSSSELVSANIAASTSQPYSHSVVALRTSGGQATIASAGNNASESLFATAANNVGMYAGGSVATAAATDGVVHTLQFLFNNASSILYVDATSNAGNIATSNSISSGAPFGFPSQLSGGLTGQVFESGYWSGDKSANFAAMHTNQCTYWGTTC